MFWAGVPRSLQVRNRPADGEFLAKKPHFGRFPGLRSRKRGMDIFLDYFQEIFKTEGTWIGNIGAGTRSSKGCDKEKKL